MKHLLRKTVLSVILAALILVLFTAAPLHQAKAQTNNTNTDWFMQGKFGLFIQWLDGTFDVTGDFNTSVNDFDVDYFAKQANETGAKYVIFTLGQNSGYFASPNATYDSLVGRNSTTTKMSTRDLPMDLYDALSPYGIKLFIYLGARTPSDDTSASIALGDPLPIYDNLAPQAFQAKWESIIQEWSDRYGSKVAGWWFDGTFQLTPLDLTSAYNDYTKSHNFQTFAAAAKHGNPDAIVAFNPGLIISSVATHADYIAGEQNLLQYYPSDYNTAPYTRWLSGLQWSELAYQGNNWNDFGLKYTTPNLTNYFSKVTNQSGVISIGPHVNRYGHINSPQYAQLLAIHNSLSGTGPGVTVVDDADAAITYSGTWGTSIPSGTGYSSNTGHYTTSSGSYSQYVFNGTNVVWSGVKGPDHGTADVYIDGVLDQSVNLYTATRLVNTEIYAKTGLSNGSHTIKIVARADKDAASTGYYVEVDRYNITSGAPATVDDAAGSVSYSGTWSTAIPSGTGYADNTGHYTLTTGSYSEYTFTGKSVEWYGVLGPDHGKADVYIDGVLDQTVDLYNANRYINNLLYVKTGLSNTSHTIRVTARSDKNASASNKYVEVDRFNTSQGMPIITLDDTNSQLPFTGTWFASDSGSYYNGTSHATSTTGSYVQTDFTGTSVDWKGKVGGDYGRAEVYIDGVLDQIVDMYAPNSALGVSVYRKQGLTSGSHTIKIVARSDKNPSSSNYYVTVDSLVVQ